VKGLPLTFPQAPEPRLQEPDLSPLDPIGSHLAIATRMDQDRNSQDNSVDSGHHPLQHQIQFSPPPQQGGSDSNGGGGNSGGGSKRKRVSLACNACRTRKSKV